MQDRVKGYYVDVKDRWTNLDKVQQMRLGLTALALVIALGVTIFISTRPRFVPLYTNLTFAEVSQVENALNAEGIRSRLINNGTGIEVPQDDAARAQLALAVANVPMGAGTFTFQDALDASGMTATSRVIQENFQRLRQSDLETTIALMDGINFARVILEIPRQDNYFLPSQEEARAAVTLNVSRPISQEQGMAIARLISRSVRDLDLTNIEIMDQNANVIFSGIEHGMGGGHGSQLDLEMLQRRDMEARVRAMLSPQFDEIAISSHLVFDRDQTVTRERFFELPGDLEDSDTGFVNQETLRTASTTGTQAGFEPGLAWNVAAMPTYPMGVAESGSARMSDRATTFLYDEREIVVEHGSGQLNTAGSSMALTAYRFWHIEQDYFEANGLIPAGLSWTQFQESLFPEPIEVSEGLAAHISAATGIQNVSITAYMVPVFHDSVIEPFALEQFLMFAILAILILLLAYGLIKKAQPDEITEVEPELSVEDLLVSTQMEEQLEAQEDVDFSSKESEIKRQIERFVTERPEAVAQLLRNWLNDEWE